ncbi:MAG TPA: hypothetical protein VF808_09290 [Ktedonobacterales bacterium]
MDEFEQQPQQPEVPQDANATSRRNFLKVAVVSSAAAAAAVGGAGVAASALASRAPSGLSKLLVLNTNVVSTTNACFTNTDFQEVSALNPNESFYVWAWFTLPSGNGGETFTASLSSATPLPSYVTYQGSKQQKAFANGSGCPNADPSLSLTTLGKSDTLPVTFKTDASGDSTVLIQVHLNASSAPAGSITLTIELTGPGGYDTTATTTVTFS